MAGPAAGAAAGAAGAIDALGGALEAPKPNDDLLAFVLSTSMARVGWGALALVVSGLFNHGASKGARGGAAGGEVVLVLEILEIPRGLSC